RWRRSPSATRARRTLRCSPRRCSPPTMRMSHRRCPRSASARATRSPATTTRAFRSGVDVTTVGILGGGQLARMLALAGAPLGLRFLVMDTQSDACAGQFAPLLVGDYRDEDALAEFASKIDVATFDFENVPAESAQWLSERVPVFPNPRALGLIQDRLAEKTLFRDTGIPVPAFADVTT